MWCIDWDEWYPVYSIEEKNKASYWEIEVDLDPEFITRYNDALNEWRAVQTTLQEMVREKRNNGT